jgi:hypothetical protein
VSITPTTHDIFNIATAYSNVAKHMVIQFFKMVCRISQPPPALDASNDLPEWPE